MRNPLWTVLSRWRRPTGGLDQSVLPSDSPEAMRDLLSALTAEARADELRGMAEPLALYRSTTGRARVDTIPERRPAMFPRLIGARGGAAVAGVVIGLGATSLVAYAAMWQSARPDVVVPAVATPSPKPTDRGVGPDATGPAAFGLCNAWANHQKHDDAVDRAEDSVAMRNLAAAAGGEGKIAAYCASIPHPGKGNAQTKGGNHGKGDEDDEAGQPGNRKAPPRPSSAKPTGSPSPTVEASPSPTSTSAPVPTPSSTATP
jgi:hypothetical protein